MRRINILIFFTLITICSYAQDTLRFVRTSYNIIDTSSFNNFSFTDTAFNNGPGVINAPITFMMKVNSIVDTNTSQFNSSQTISPFDTIAPGQRKILNFTINNDTAPPFIIGPNTIVIWPVYYNGGSPAHIGPNDSIIIHTYYYPLGIADAPLAKMYIYQVSGHLNVNFGDDENIVQQVRIFDILGQEMYMNSPDRSKNINTAGWPSGIYLCEISTFNGEKRTFKFKLER